MPRTSPVDTVIDAVVDRLSVASGISGVATVWNYVPQGTTYPYIDVSSPTDRREDAFGQLGASVLVDVHIVSQNRGDTEAAGLMDAVIQSMSTALTLSGHTCFGVAWEGTERFREVVNAIVTRHHVATFRVWTGQS